MSLGCSMGEPAGRMPVSADVSALVLTTVPKPASPAEPVSSASVLLYEDENELERTRGWRTGPECHVRHRAGERHGRTRWPVRVSRNRRPSPRTRHGLDLTRVVNSTHSERHELYSHAQPMLSEQLTASRAWRESARG